MAEVKTISKEELETLQNLQRSYSEITAKFGQLKVEQLILQSQLTRLGDLETQTEVEYSNIQTRETEYLKSLESKYGKISVNIETGEIS